jgi:hypothetical protein
MLPVLRGRPIRVELRASLGPHLAATSIPRRLILLDADVLTPPREFERILVHEIFHFVWVRLSNEKRWSWEGVVGKQLTGKARGELGWSAEWRKLKLKRVDRQRRTRAWRRYVCESFCDTAAWRFSGLKAHPEFTLPAPARRSRRAWFTKNLPPASPVSI